MRGTLKSCRYLYLYVTVLFYYLYTSDNPRATRATVRSSFVSLFSRFEMDSIIREFDIVRGQNRLSRMLKLYKGKIIRENPIQELSFYRI